MTNSEKKVGQIVTTHSCLPDV